MSKMSNYLEDLLLNRVLRGQAFTPPTNVYLGLFTSVTFGGDGDPTSFTEVSTSGTAYSRQAITFNAANAGQALNNAQINFSVATTDWGTTTHWGIFDAASGGNLLYWGDHADRAVLSGEQFTVEVNQISVSIASGVTATFANSLLDATLRAQALAAPTVRVALLTAFTNDTTYTECADANYARQTATFNAPSNGSCTNSADVVYPAMALDRTITHGALFDAATNGNMLWRGALAASKLVQSAKVFKFTAGTIAVGLQ